MRDLLSLSPIRQEIKRLIWERDGLDDRINQTPEEHNFCNTVDTLYDNLTDIDNLPKPNRTDLCELEDEIELAQYLLIRVKEASHAENSDWTDEERERTDVPPTGHNSRKTAMAFRSNQ